MRKPKYITELELKIAQCEIANKEIKLNQDNLLVSQGDLMSKQNENHNLLNEIRNCLLGTEYDKDINGGLVKKVVTIRSDVETLKKWRDKITVTAGILYSVMTAALAFFSTIIVKNWDKIFK